MPQPVDLSNPNAHKLWEAIHRIPDDILEDYLADDVIDDQEIEDITTRLSQNCKQYGSGLNMDKQCHQLIRALVRYAVEHIQQQAKSQAIEAKLSPVTLRNVRQAMGNLLESGQIILSSHDVKGAPSYSPDLPDNDDDDEPDDDYPEEFFKL